MDTGEIGENAMLQMKQTKQTEHKQVSFRRLVHDALPAFSLYCFFRTLTNNLESP